MSFSVLCGDVLERLPEMEPQSFDAVLCDPPYGLSFMGKAWDHGVPGEEVWRMVSAALKPGAPLLAFGGTRTYHRLACAIEDAGFEIRDSLCWLYGSGFPKSLDISKAIDKAAGHWRGRAGAVTIHSQPAKGTEYERTEKGDPITAAAAAWQGYGTALKPAWEPCILAMKPTDGTFAQNAEKWGVAGLNVDGGRIPGDVPSVPQPNFRCARNHRTGLDATSRNGSMSSAPLGRWPANVLLDEEAAAALDEQSGVRKAGGTVRGSEPSETGQNGIYGRFARVANSPHNDTGGASRFFYCAKSSRREREAGLEGLPTTTPAERTGRKEGSAGLVMDGGKANPYAGNTGAQPARNHHPTVKPLALCEYLARLILPPKRDTPRRLLVPFSGSGSEMIGALLAGWDEVVGIEREPEYAEIAEARLRHWTREQQLKIEGVA